MNNPFSVTVIRDNFRFKMKISESSDTAFNSFTFEVESGDASKPCLKLYVRVPVANNERIVNASSVASLLNIEALLKCVIDDINNNYIRKHKFSHELLETVNHILVTYFPHVKYVELYDASFMPCNRDLNDTLDLLTYSIALYGKTWYEIKLGAYPKNPIIRNLYKQQIDRYTSEDFKQSLNVDDFLFKISASSNEYARTVLRERKSEIINLYETSKTFPIFFKKLRNIIPDNDKCKFFKRWLDDFIHESIHNLDRNWIYNVHHNNLESNVGGTRLRRTRRRKRARIF